jgi:fused signal recognition particle receptor
MKDAVTRTRENLSERIEDVIALSKEIDRATLDDLEATLIGADLGTTTTHDVLQNLRDKADRKQIKNADELKRLLKEELLGILTAANSQPVQRVDATPEVILIVGVNGTGKTTTIGKLTQVFRSQGKTVLLCAADTFRAAAIEQLEIWGERTGTEVIRTKAGGDPSAVLFDALQAASARQTDYVIVDTAGRLHTKTNLMAELEKMRRTARRIIPGAPHETLLVMDATTGQNGLQQARLFTASAGVTGIVLTKLDGTATPSAGDRLRQIAHAVVERLRRGRQPPGDPYADNLAAVRRGPKGRSGAAVAEPEDDSYRSFPPRSR